MAGILDIISGAGVMLGFILTLVEAMLVRTGSMMADAVLVLISFVAPGLGSVIYLAAYIGTFTGGEASEFLYTFIAIPFVLLGIMAITGGIFAIMRKRWGLGLAGTLCGLACNFTVGVVAVVLMAVARAEFKS